MAKTIKFNLICDNNPVRTIEDLQNNFSIEDVLAYYNSRLLHRWLEVRGYTEELNKINDIIVKSPIQIVKELIKIFNVACDDKKVEESVYILEYLDERKELCSLYDMENYKVKSIIDDYQTGYRQLVERILENPEDVAKIKASISEMVNNYRWVFELNYRELFWSLVDKSTLAIMCLLMNEQSRNYFVPIKGADKNGVESLNAEEKLSKKNISKYFNTEAKLDNNTEAKLDNNTEAKLDNNIFKEICRIIKSADFVTDLGDNLISFAGITDGYWKDLEPKGKKYMIISMGSGSFVRSSGLSGGDLASTDILHQFVIVDGIDYKSNSEAHQLLYMEV